MVYDRTRRTGDARQAAEAAFKAATTKPVAPAPAPAPKPPVAAPGARESVTLRLDSAVLEYFQKDGPGWQDRINDALKRLIGA
ncbi:BrnA antitoxin family protein [Methylobacterium nigriterrae]|uniref:BrnA antitoxin family protein n=1 Tax=Methylobacterium nigriterrae TaxID=3127512 RepID=UPI0030138C05